MKKFKKLFLLASLPLIIGMSSCGGPAEEPHEDEPVAVERVDLSQTVLEMMVADTVQLTYSVTPANAQLGAVTWKSDNEAIAMVSGGLVIAISAGQTKVHLLDANNQELASCTVNVSAPIVEVKLLALDLNEAEASIQIGETYDLSTQIVYLPRNTTQKDVSYSSSNPDIATVDPVTGLVTGVSSGTASIIVTSKENNNIYTQLSVSVLAEWVDYTEQAKLFLDYSGKDFYQDGIGQVNLFSTIDGDTAHFTPKNGGDTIKIRFFGIDTPESTGNIQEYGKQASNFTKDLLKKAKTIVISSPTDEYEAPGFDSTGSRFMGLVWVNLEKENAPKDELILVNLAVAQAGLCITKNDGEYARYNEYFSAANQQAKLYKLKLFSGEPDPFFNYDTAYPYQPLTKLRAEIEKYTQDRTYVNAFDNKKVRIQGTVVGYVNNNLYLSDYYPDDPDNPDAGGEYAGVSVFCGMSPIPDKFQARGTYVEICGTVVNSEEFGPQIQDTQGHFNPAENPEYLADRDCSVIYRPEDNTDYHAIKQFVYTKDELNAIAQANDGSKLFCLVKVTSKLKCNYFNISDKNAITLGFENSNFSAYIPNAFYGNPELPNYRWMTEADFKGKEFFIEGAYCYHFTQKGKLTWQITPSKASDIRCADYYSE